MGIWGFNHRLSTTQFVPYCCLSITKITSLVAVHFFFLRFKIYIRLPWMFLTLDEFLQCFSSFSVSYPRPCISKKGWVSQHRSTVWKPWVWMDGCVFFFIGGSSLDVFLERSSNDPIRCYFRKVSRECFFRTFLSQLFGCNSRLV